MSKLFCNIVPKDKDITKDLPPIPNAYSEADPSDFELMYWRRKAETLASELERVTLERDDAIFKHGREQAMRVLAESRYCALVDAMHNHKKAAPAAKETTE